MTQALPKYARYRADFQASEKIQPDNQPAWAREIRRLAWRRFEELGFPTARRGNEEWKYTSVLPIANGAFEYPFELHLTDDTFRRGNSGNNWPVKRADLRRLTPWHESWVNLVFVNGQYAPGLSSPSAQADGSWAKNLARTIRANEDVLRLHLAKYASFEDDGFTALNTAFLSDGAFVHVTEGNAPDSVIHLIFVSANAGRPSVSHPRTLVLADSNTKLTIVESYVGLSKAPSLTNAVTEMVVGDGAQLVHYRYLAEASDAFHVGVTRVHQGEDSTFHSTSFAVGADIARNDLHVFLDAPRSSCFLRGLYLTSGTQHIDNHISIDHIKPHTTSRQYFKGILAGKSKAVYSGRVLVHKGAQKTDAHQADKNLILSEGAEVDTKPSLEIYADDVKCGHGATAGQVAQDALFYLRSRGLDLQTAATLLIHGFASEIINNIQLDQFRVYLDNLFSKSLPSFQLEGTS